MKKLVSVFLCMVIICFALVGCTEDIVKGSMEELDNLKSNEVSDDKIETLNFYIITGENTSEEAQITVPQNINAYIKEKYNIILNIVYCTIDEYNDTVFSAIEKKDESERPDVILINSESMYDALRADDRLVSLNDFYKSRDFRSLNTIIDDRLLRASAEVDENGESLSYYATPNNHLIGEYEYIVIDKAMARDTLHFSNAEIEAMTTDESLNELKSAIANYYGSDDPTYIDRHVKIVNGNYYDKVLLEYDVDGEIPEGASKKNIVNVSSYPVATKAEAFRSAFAIIKQLDDVGNLTEEQEAKLNKHYSKCMSIIFALNTDVQLKNMLQYGYVGTNYKFEKNDKNENTNYITLIKGTEVIYEMDLIHTGNLFLNYYCEEIGWNEKTHNNILRQNAEAMVP